MAPKKSTEKSDRGGPSERSSVSINPEPTDVFEASPAVSEEPAAENTAATAKVITNEELLDAAKKLEESSYFTRGGDDSIFASKTSVGSSFSASDRHTLHSTVRGESEIEKLASKIEDRRANRIPVTFDIRKRFLEECRQVAMKTGTRNKIHVRELEALRDKYRKLVDDHKENTAQKSRRYLKQMFGLWHDERTLLELLEKALKNTHDLRSRWFYFRDFNFYYTVVVPKRQFLKNTTLVTVQLLLAYYFFTAVFFCAIIRDDQVCPADPSGEDRIYYGWLTSIYFASVTMSTVGYGDVSLAGDSRWKIFIGIIFMLVSLIVAYTVFASAAQSAVSRFGLSETGNSISKYVFNYINKYDGESVPLYIQIRRVFWLRAVELVLYFLFFNFVGVVFARFFIRQSELESQQWTWMTTFYWAIQTTTTIGYGDLDMPFDFRWFQIFYTTFGTALVGSVFGAIASLKTDIQSLRRFYAWRRREVSKRLIEDMKGNSDDDRIDQFEFLVGSLIMLNKVEKDDIVQIMDKFRELAGDKGFLMYSEAEEEGLKAEEEAVAAAENSDIDLADEDEAEIMAMDEGEEISRF